ncbi:MAG: Ribosomal protein, partial [Pseudomonadota bacterium]
MELHKVKKEELKGFDAGKLRETEKDIRRQLHDIRMDIYSGPGKHTGKIRGLRRTLARVLTLQHASKLG